MEIKSVPPVAWPSSAHDGSKSDRKLFTRRTTRRSSELLAVVAGWTRKKELVVKVMPPEVAQRKRKWVLVYDVGVVLLLCSAAIATFQHTQYTDASHNVVYESVGDSITPYFVRDSIPVPPVLFFEIIRRQQVAGVLNPATIVMDTNQLKSFDFNQSYQTFDEVTTLQLATPVTQCLGALSGSGYGYCRLSLPLALPTFARLPFFPLALINRIHSDIASSSKPLTHVVLSSYGYSVQTDLNIVKLKDCNPNFGVSLSLCVNATDVEVVNSYVFSETQNCINYGNINTFGWEFVRCDNATFRSSFYEQICYALIGEHGAAMTFDGKVKFRTGEIVHGLNGLLLPPSKDTPTAGYMLLPSDAA